MNLCFLYASMTPSLIRLSAFLNFFKRVLCPSEHTHERVSLTSIFGWFYASWTCSNACPWTCLQAFNCLLDMSHERVSLTSIFGWFYASWTCSNACPWTLLWCVLCSSERVHDFHFQLNLCFLYVFMNVSLWLPFSAYFSLPRPILFICSWTLKWLLTCLITF